MSAFQHKQAKPDHPIHDLIAQRWSPYAFSDQSISKEDLRSILEAARWAASSYNEQPWSYIVARKEDADAFEKLLSCLVEANQTWAKNAAVLMLGTTRLKFARNDKPNDAAIHDLGLANATLTLEAMNRGIFVHQMIGIVPAQAKALYQVPEDVEVKVGLALGYPAPAETLPEQLQPRDQAERGRKPLAEFVFANGWGNGADLK